jgi:outer membrane cobalamin receptor
VSPDSTYDRLESRPRHKIDGLAAVTFPWQMTFRVGFTWALDTLVYTWDLNPDDEIEAFETRHLDDFVLLDLKLEQPLWENRLRLYVGVDNLLDEEWTYNYGYPQAGRAVFGGLRLRL